MSSTADVPLVSSNKLPGPMAAIAAVPGEQIPPGQPLTMQQHVIGKGAELVQSLKPVKQISQHVCTFAMYSHDMYRQIETHHFVTRLNQDFLQCSVYNADDRDACLIGVEYIISEKLFQDLPLEEQKLWHSHAHEVKSGLWVSPRVPEMVAKHELENLARTYGKFWCTWQVDRVKVTSCRWELPELMMSPQEVNLGVVKPDLVKKRDDKYNISTESLKEARLDVTAPDRVSTQADYWKHHGKGFAVDVLPAAMELRAPFP